jgi:hypothetical protein
MFLTLVGMMIALFSSAGATIGAMITMHASIAQRSREWSSRPSWASSAGSSPPCAPPA